MIKPVCLDETRYGALYDRAAAGLAARCPAWDGSRVSDPGVTLLELAAYLSDVQNYAADAVQDAHYRAYARLLGGAPRALAPARLRAAVRCAQGMETLPARTRFFAGALPFETAEPVRLLQNELTGFTGTDGGVLTLRFAAPLRPGEPVPLYCGIEPTAGRVPPDTDTPPPVLLAAEVRAGEAWLPAALTDGTCGLLQSGVLRVVPAAEGVVLRIYAAGGTWDVPPVVREMRLNTFELVQRRTRAWSCEGAAAIPEGAQVRRFTREGEGWRAGGTERAVCAEPDFAALHPLQGVAGQRVPFAEAGVLPESLRVMVHEGALWYDCPVLTEAPEGDTLPRGCRYLPEENALCFGDGRDFAIPPAGELLLAGCAVTRGASGNGVAGVLRAADAEAGALAPAYGGRDAEGARAAFFRLAAEQDTPLRAVTCAEYEAQARRAPGLAIDAVRALPRAALQPGEPGVELLVRPRAQEARPALPDWYRAVLAAFLEPYRLLGVPLTVRGPRYVPLVVSVRLRGGAAAQDAARAEAGRFAGGAGAPAFGARLRHAGLFAALSALPQVRAVEGLRMYPAGPGAARLPDGDLQLEPDALPCLERFECTLW